MRRILSVIGTRPEAIKVAPVVLALQARADAFESVVCTTGQHAELLHQALGEFKVHPVHDLAVMRPGQTLGEVTARVVDGLAGVLDEVKPDVVLVHGDTTTTLAAALAAFYARIPLGHVEAGLRTGNLQDPFPEEANRSIVDRLAAHCYAPTEASRRNLLREGIDPARIVVTGNSAIDALHLVSERAAARPTSHWRRLLPASVLDALTSDRPLVVVTAHRRESFGQGLREICAALRELAQLHPDWRFVYPVHPNPNVRGTVEKALADSSGSSSARKAR